MRLFIAAELPRQAAIAAAGLGDLLRERVTQMAPRARLTWVAPDRMHLTLRFIGHVDAAAAERVLAVLAEPLQSAAFFLTLGQAGAYPSRGNPRVLWVGMAQGRQELQQVEREVSARIERAGIQPDDRPFSPHLTVARVHDPDGLRGAAALDGINAPPGAGGVVDAITLFESRLSPKGPAYTALQRTPLCRA